MRVMTSIGVALLAIVGTALLTLVSTASSMIALAARTSVLVMGGSGSPLTTEQDGIEYVERYLGKAVDNFVQPASAIPGSGIPAAGADGYNAVAVITPAEFYPDAGELTYDESVAEGLADLDTCITGSAGPCVYNSDVPGSEAPAPDDTFIVFGFSQSATIATFEKRDLAATYPDGGGPDVSFILIANGNRPNGGFLARGPRGVTIPLGLTYGGATFSGPTPTDTQYPTVDFAVQYDLWSDGPVNPLNLLALMNATIGGQQRHPYSVDQSLDGPGIIDQGQYGDTSYYLAASDTLPLLTPIEQIPGIGEALAQTLDPFFRVIVESAYNREASPGEPTSWNVFYGPDPLEFVHNLALAIPTGLDNGAEFYTGDRPFGTTAPGPYGIGGPDVTWLDPADAPDELSGEPTTAVEASVDAAAITVDDAKADISGDTDTSGDVDASTNSADSANVETTTDAATDSDSTEPASAAEVTSETETGDVEEPTKEPTGESTDHPADDPSDDPTESSDSPEASLALDGQSGDTTGHSTDDPARDNHNDRDDQDSEPSSTAEKQDDDDRASYRGQSRERESTKASRGSSTSSTSDSETSSASNKSESDQ